MRLEKKKDDEIAARQGMTGRTIITVIWLGISALAAYFLVQYIFDTNVLRYSTFYNMGLPSSVPKWVIMTFLVIIVVAIMQTFLMFGFMIASPEGRRRTGDPTAYSRSKEEDFTGRS
jgi:putative flippase GtrA